MRVRLSKLARIDLFGIWDFLAETSERTANDCIKRITARLDPLIDFPEMGVERPDIAPAMRMFVVERWIAFYRIETGEVRVIRIVDGARDLTHLRFSDE